MDMAGLMGMFGRGGGGGMPPQGGMQMPQAQLGQATMGGPAPQGMGFGLGQQMMAPGASAGDPNQYAQQGGMAGMLGGLEGLDMQKLGPLMQMMQMQNQQQGQPQHPQMMQMGGGGGGGQGGQRDYLAQGGGIAPRQIVNKGY